MSRTAAPPQNFGNTFNAAQNVVSGPVQSGPTRQYTPNPFAAQATPPAHNLGPGMNATPTYTRGGFSMPVNDQSQWNRLRGMDDKSLNRLQSVSALLTHMRRPRGVTTAPTQNQAMMSQALRQPRGRAR